MTSRTSFKKLVPCASIRSRKVDHAIHKAFGIPLLAQEAEVHMTYLGGGVTPIFKLVKLHPGRRGWNGEDQKEAKEMKT